MHLIFKLKIIHVKIFRGVKFSQFHLIRKILMVLTAKLHHQHIFWPRVEVFLSFVLLCPSAPSDG